MHDLRFLNFLNFKWAIPYAFNKAIDQCSFEVGDILYDNVTAYLPWRDPENKVKYHIQIKEKFPPSVFDKSYFFSNQFYRNWGSKLIIEFVDYENNIINTYNTTQGRLFTYLIKGDIAALTCTQYSIKPPKFLLKNFGICKPPLTFELNDCQKKKRTACYNKVKNNIRKKVKNHFLTDFDMSYQTMFLTSCNIAEVSQLTNLRTVIEKITNNYETITNIHNPKNILGEKYYFSPTTPIISVLVKSIDKQNIENIIKSVLYKPYNSNKTEKELFKLDSHGILL